MMFISDEFKCGLLTIHEALINVPNLIDSKRLSITVETILNSMKVDFKIDNPSLAILGLNPHAGENGHIGREELDVIIPFIKEKTDNLCGPFVPDAFFGNKSYNKYDFILGMYHDQVLIPFKMLAFERGVNFTAGLPIIRTSPDHGTAYDIAGKFKANPTSMIEAYKWAKLILTNRKTR